MLSKFFKGKDAAKQEVYTGYQHIYWDSDVDTFKLNPGETIIDALSPVKDYIGVKTSSVAKASQEGALTITSLRILFSLKKNASTNISIGLQTVNRISIEPISKNSAWTITISCNYNGSKYEFIFKYDGLEIPRCFNAALNVLRAFENCRLYRQLSLRRDFIVREGVVQLLPAEKEIRTLSGVWNLSSDSGNLGILVFTTLRIIWYCLTIPEFNVSTPLMGIVPSTRNSKFGDAFVLKVETYMLGFLVDEYRTPQDLAKLVLEVQQMIDNARSSPQYGIVINMESLPLLENPFEYTVIEASGAASKTANGPVAKSVDLPPERDAVPEVIVPVPNGVLDMTEADLEEAFKMGKKAWGRSKIMIVGEGRAGKTALANSIIGQSFQDTSSTAALAQMIADQKLHRRHKQVEEFDFSADVFRSVGAWGAEETADFSSDLSSLVDSSITPTLITEKPVTVPLLNVPSDSNIRANADTEVLPIRDANESLDVVDMAGTASTKYNKEDESETEVNNDLVMKCLANGVQTESKFIISLFDFGGQSVFNVIHPFFLTKYGVYIVTFNMEWLVRDAIASDRADCLAYMTFWINSVVVHTKNEKDEVSPIVIVGTRKDKVRDPAEHEAISTLLYETYSSSIAWPYILEYAGASGANGKSDLFFYPIDNTLGRGDPALQKLLSAIENVIDESDYVHAEQPLTWIRTLDKLKAKSDSYILYSEVEKIAKTCDVPRNMVPKFLYFLHEMGMVMWHSDEGLKDVVILDPIDYFVKPATVVICKHAPKKDDAIYHSLAIHKKVKKKMKNDWDLMVSYGLVSDVLLSELLESSDDHRYKIVKLMLKYGLLVKIVNTVVDEGANPTDLSFEDLMTVYIAPALLPDCKSAEEDGRTFGIKKPWPEVKISSSFYFLFSIAKVLFQKSIISLKNCQELGFLPSGLFERLICKAVGWCQDTSVGSSVQTVDITGLYKDEAVLYFGAQQFRLRLLNQYNMIEVVVQGESPVAVHERLRDQVEKVISECMKSLKFSTILEYCPQGKAFTDSYFLRVHQLYSAMEKRSTLAVVLENGSRELLQNADLVSEFGPWLQKFQIFDRYDVFLSYRWGNYDSSFVCSVFDRLTLFTIDSSHRSIATFLDNRRLQMGRQIQRDLVRALKSTQVFVPVVSVDACTRMLHHDPTIVDNVLFEWIVALNCYRHRDCRINMILPVLFGSRKDGVTGNFFSEGIVDRLPTYEPTATIELAHSLLKDLRVSVREDLLHLSVRDIAKQLLQFMCVLSWNETENAALIARVTDALIDSLAEPLQNSDISPTPAVQDSVAVGTKPVSDYTRTAVDAELQVIPLEKLSVEQVGFLLVYIDLPMYVDDFKSNHVDGEVLSLSETTEDLKEVGVTKGIHAKKILKITADMKVSGVDRSKLVPPAVQEPVTTES